MFPPPSSLLAPPSFASLTRETACSTGGDGGKDIVSRIEMDATKPNYRGAAKDGSFAANPSPPLSKRPPLNFAQNFLLLLLLLFVYTYIHVYAYACVYFFYFFFYPGDADENRNSMVSKICLSHLASSSFNPQFVRAASTTSDRFRFHPPSRRTL